MVETQYIPQADQRIALAKQACACDHAYGIAFVCPATLLPRMGEMVMIRGPVCELRPQPYPLRFECPRHEIMGW